MDFEQQRSIINAFWETEGRKQEILRTLEQLDLKSVRPLREGEAVRVAELEAQAEVLRQELRTLNGENE